MKILIFFIGFCCIAAYAVADPAEAPPDEAVNSENVLPPPGAPGGQREKRSLLLAAGLTAAAGGGAYLLHKRRQNQRAQQKLNQLDPDHNGVAGDQRQGWSLMGRMKQSLRKFQNDQAQLDNLDPDHNGKVGDQRSKSWFSRLTQPTNTQNGNMPGGPRATVYPTNSYGQNGYAAQPQVVPVQGEYYS